MSISHISPKFVQECFLSCPSKTLIRPELVTVRKNDMNAITAQKMKFSIKDFFHKCMELYYEQE